ncbi:hypothetical protein PULV_a3405 [Pseudoalteromonas ulvae UL12]|uniref:EpsG family protein n=1 Tax=Pseudoalteromonas ulvae TaxID=107327 RepID=UPI0015940F77|nr:EpsG family protein [Pseudoalteromonas ulvae]MBE0365092.1 hypothetical protein [Pseudoalteromonas ulvae UL12]
MNNLAIRELSPVDSIRNRLALCGFGVSVLLILWFIVPTILWLALTFLFALSFHQSYRSNTLALVVSATLAFLVSSRYVGFLWGGADDMPSYFMAYQNYRDYSGMLATSLIYAKHADFLFGLFSWAVAAVSDNHAFIYYFVTLFLTYVLIWCFFKMTGVANPFLCFLLTVLFYKLFQSQWHLIRACMAIPILLSGILLARNNFKKGFLIFIIGGLFHFSTFFMLFPLLLLGRYLDKKWQAADIIKFLVLFFGAVIGVVLSVKLLSATTSNYMLNKIATRLVFEPSFAKAPTFLFMLIINIAAIPGYLRTSNIHFFRVFNIFSFINFLCLCAIFVIGDELHRILLPLYLLYPLVLFYACEYLNPKPLLYVFIVGLISFLLFAFTYVIWINESNFYYLAPLEKHPLEFNGVDHVRHFKTYLIEDITYYDGYRNK